MLEELVYSAAQRALDQQSTALSDLRTRTSTLVAAATLSASFLGAAAIGRGAPAWAVVLAMAAFLLAGAFAGWVLWPARVSFAVDIDRMYDELARVGHGDADVDARPCANLIAMPDQPTPAPNPIPAPPDVGRMSLDVFMYENEGAHERAQARKRAVKRWINRLLKRSSQIPS